MYSKIKRKYKYFSKENSISRYIVSFCFGVKGKWL